MRCDGPLGCPSRSITEAACRIVVLEDRLEETQRVNEPMRPQGEAQSKTSACLAHVGRGRILTVSERGRRLIAAVQSKHGP